VEYMPNLAGVYIQYPVTLGKIPGAVRGG
jgi:hypothetical protein